MILSRPEHWVINHGRQSHASRFHVHRFGARPTSGDPGATNNLVQDLSQASEFAERPRRQINQGVWSSSEAWHQTLSRDLGESAGIGVGASDIPDSS